MGTCISSNKLVAPTKKIVRESGSLLRIAKSSCSSKDKCLYESQALENKDSAHNLENSRSASSRELYKKMVTEMRPIEVNPPSPNKPSIVKEIMEKSINPDGIRGNSDKFSEFGDLERNSRNAILETINNKQEAIQTKPQFPRFLNKSFNLVGGLNNQSNIISRDGRVYIGKKTVLKSLRYSKGSNIHIKMSALEQRLPTIKNITSFRIEKATNSKCSSSLRDLKLANFRKMSSQFEIPTLKDISRNSGARNPSNSANRNHNDIQMMRSNTKQLQENNRQYLTVVNKIQNYSSGQEDDSSDESGDSDNSEMLVKSFLNSSKAFLQDRNEPLQK